MGVDSQLPEDWEDSGMSGIVDPSTWDTCPAEFPEHPEDPTIPTPVLSTLDARILELQHFGCIKSK